VIHLGFGGDYRGKVTLIKDKLNFECSFKFINVEKECFYINITTSLLVNEFNETIGFIAYLYDYTDEHTTSLKLELKNQKLHEFFELSKDVFCIGDIEGKILILNRSFYRLFGYEENEVLEKYFFNFIHPDDLLLISKEMEKLINGINSIDFEHRFRCKSGEFKWMLSNASYDLETGQVFCTMKDITEKRIQENRLSQIWKAINKSAIVVQTDRNGIILEVNENFEMLSGYSRAELVGKNHKIVNSGNHPKEFFKNMWKKINGGEIWSGEIQNKTKSGKVYTVQTVISPLLNTNGEIEKFLSIRFDVTNLKYSERLLESAQALGKVGSWYYEFDTNKAVYSKELYNILERAENLGPLSLDEFSSMIYPDDKTMVLASIFETLDHKKDMKLRYRIMINHQVKWIEATRVLQINSEKIAYSMIGLFQDITELVHLEEKVKQESIIANRTSRLATLGEMAAGMAHELNNPLTILSLTIRKIQSKISSNEIINESSFESMFLAINRINKIVNGLKKFSQRELRSNTSEVCIDKLIKQSVVFDVYYLETLNVKLTLQIDSSAYILCDEVEMNHVFYNLLNNSLHALKYISKKEIILKVFDVDHHVKLLFLDSGEGINEKFHEKIFQPFFTTKDVGQGTGLGLSVIKGILESHQSLIEYKRLNNYTCFEITFPKIQKRKNIA
jgi:PAS domain S-box-containing protein